MPSGIFQLFSLSLTLLFFLELLISLISHWFSFLCTRGYFFSPKAITDCQMFVNFFQGLCTSNNPLFLHFFLEVLPPIASWFSLDWLLSPNLISICHSFLHLFSLVGLFSGFYDYFSVYFRVLLCFLISFHYDFDRFLERGQKSTYMFNLWNLARSP